jgi:tetratricopeptide (TPR) repeat protein
MGYDDSREVFLAYDTFLGFNQGEGRPAPYSVFDENWRHFSRTFIVVYDPARETDLRRALGVYADPAGGAGVALEAVRTEVSNNPDDAWGWFGMGTAYVALGEYENAAVAYREAIQLGLPWRILWYQFGPYEAYFHMGDYNNVLALAENTLATTRYVEETYFWKGMALAAGGDADAAGDQFAEAIRLNRNFFTAQSEYFRLETASFDLPPQVIPVLEYIVPSEASEIIQPIMVTPTVVPPPNNAIATPVPVITATPILVQPDASATVPPPTP